MDRTKKTMYNREFTPERITELKPNEIFVFGSNLEGSHGGAALFMALMREEYGSDVSEYWQTAF